MNSNITYRCCICRNLFPSTAVIFRNDDKNICFNCHEKSCMNQMNVMPDRSILEAEIKRLTAENAALRAELADSKHERAVTVDRLTARIMELETAISKYNKGYNDAIDAAMAHIERLAKRAQPDEHPASNDDVWNMLQYIANSPAQEHGGFSPSAVRAAHKAIYWIRELCANIAALRDVQINEGYGSYRP